MSVVGALASTRCSSRVIWADDVLELAGKVGQGLFLAGARVLAHGELFAVQEQDDVAVLLGAAKLGGLLPG